MRPRRCDRWRPPTRRAGPLTVARPLFVAVSVALVVAVCLVASSVRAQTPVPIPPIAPPKPPASTPILEPPSDPSPWSGKSVTRVVVVLEGSVWNDVEVPVIHDVSPGDVLTAAAARRALAELLGAGHFARATASALPENGGVALLLRAAARKLVGRLESDLHGARLDRDELLRAADLAEGGEIVGADLEEIRERIARYCATHGYPSAKVALETRATDDRSRVTVRVDVGPGPPRILRDRHIYVFAAKPEQVMPVAESYGVRASDRADEPALDSADTTLEQTLRTKGWYRARVSHDLVWVEAGSGGGVVLRVRVDAGPQQVPAFEGNEHYDAETLTAALGLDQESDRSPSHLADKLRTFYERRGFLDVEVRPEMRGRDTEPVQLLVLHIDERPRVAVSARRYPCLGTEAIQHLSNGGPRSPDEIGNEIDSFLEEDLPGADLFVNPDPRGVSQTIGAGTGQVATGARPEPIDLHPDASYVADTYERAIEHVQELYRNEGFLHAAVGPVQILRGRCDPRSPASRCIARAVPALPVEVCTYDPSGLPLPAPTLDQAFTCRPDPAHGVECAPSMELVIPVKLGPRTRLWDVAFTGVKSLSEKEVAAAGDFPLGEPVSTIKLDDARRRIVEHYKELGYAYVDVKYTLEPSLDSTRARLRFDVTEGDQVIVRTIVIRGLVGTHESVVQRRLALKVGEPYRTSDVNKTRERLETLGVFSEVTVAMSDPYVPQAKKTVYIDVVERLPRYFELRPGFSTGEGIRGTVEYDERNVLGYAISAVFRAQLSYLPDFLILDPQVATNYLQISDRLARRITLSGTFPDVGLGPQVRAQADAIYVRDLERDFALDKVSGFASLIYRPVREVTMTLGQSVEDNDVRLFQFNSTAAFLACNMQSQGFNSGLQALLRIPDGESLVVAQRASISWDRRDNAFNAHRGTFLFVGAELVNSFPEGAAVRPNVSQAACPGVDFKDPNVMNALAAAPQAFSHFVRLSQTLAGYLPLSRKVSLALELRLGENVRTAACSYVNPNPAQDAAFCTYPDRLFFMGGFDSMRGWLQDTFMPQDYADQIAKKPGLCSSSSSNCLIPLRGGNLMINPRAELRFPIYGAFDGAIFGDFGNLWVDPTYVFDHSTSLRADVGPGIRLQTPVATLVFDYGINVTRRFYEDFGAFHFAIGLF